MLLHGENKQPNSKNKNNVHETWSTVEDTLRKHTRREPPNWFLTGAVNTIEGRFVRSIETCTPIVVIQEAFSVSASSKVGLVISYVNEDNAHQIWFKSLFFRMTQMKGADIVLNGSISCNRCSSCLRYRGVAVVVCNRNPNHFTPTEPRNQNDELGFYWTENIQTPLGV